MALISHDRIRFALPLAAAHWLLLVLIQCEIFLAYVLPRTSRDITAARFALTLPLLQTENLLAAAAVGLVACLLAGRLATRWILLGLWIGLSFYLVFDQVYYKVFFDHFRPSIIEGVGQVNAAQLVSSIVHELDLAFGLNSAIVVLCAALLGWRRVVHPGAAAPQARARPGAWLVPAGAAVLFVLGIPSLFSSAYHNVQHHPLLVLADDSMRRSVIEDLRQGRAAPSEVPGPVEKGCREHDPRLVDVARACRGASRPPSVLLIVLESVGSLQLLGADGLPSPGVTPHLAKLARGGVVFDSVYSVFPATVRTHVAMTTGGRFPTWGSVYELLDLTYQGPTLPRAFAAGGYDTALFAGERLDGENMAAFMQKSGYRTFYDFANDRPHHTKETMISSWGAREEFTIGLIDRWLDAHGRASPGPFFLNYLTAATHHPYGVPDGYSGPFPGKDGFSLYRNALHYTDAAVGKLLEALAARGMLDETIVAVTGDHGQAFGTTHPLNFTHRNRINEENVKSFLIVVPPARDRLPGPVVSHRVGTTGDIMPTLLAAAGLARADVPGRSLCDEWFTPRPVFFHKHIVPEQWGLRDGPWKFIEGIRNRVAELYDLARDPDEQVNLADQHSDRVQRYDALCQRLFIGHDDEFTARLQGYHYPGGPALSAAEVRSSGPKRLAMGVAADPSLRRIVERSTFHPREQPIAYVRLVSYERETPIDFSWHSPSGVECRWTVPIDPECTSYRLPYPGPRPMEPGSWTLSLRDPAGGSELLRTQFTVSVLAAPIHSGQRDP
jgi:phosphoglycerol transferase MdoB-like AlkP superfamily enzyme